MKKPAYPILPFRSFALCLGLALLLGAGPQQTARADATYTVRQSFSVKDLPEGAKQVRGWFWMPEDRPEQRVLDFKVVEAPETMRITRDPKYGRRWLYAETAASPDKPLRVVTEFKLIRKSVKGLADPAKTGPLRDEHRRTFAAELRVDEKHNGGYSEDSDDRRFARRRGEESGDTGAQVF